MVEIQTCMLLWLSWIDLLVDLVLIQGTNLDTDTGVSESDTQTVPVSMDDIDTRTDASTKSNTSTRDSHSIEGTSTKAYKDAGSKARRGVSQNSSRRKPKSVHTRHPRKCTRMYEGITTSRAPKRQFIVPGWEHREYASTHLDRQWDYN